MKVNEVTVSMLDYINYPRHMEFHSVPFVLEDILSERMETKVTILDWMYVPSRFEFVIERYTCEFPKVRGV